MNRIYFFTGTGNSLHIAEEIAKALSDCEIIAIQKGIDPEIPAGYERIGFVFPTYGWGLPIMVSDFLGKACLSKQGNTYLFAVATCLGIAGNAIPQVNALLKEKGCRLNYGARIRMFGNAVTNYDMNIKVDEITRKSEKRTIPVVQDIVNKTERRIPSIKKIINWLYLKFISNIPTTDEKFNVNDDCVSCGICKSVCPAKNITLKDGKPTFHHQCERCLACIQHCPKRAINYDNKTQSRRRYTHPQVGNKKITNYYTNY